MPTGEHRNFVDAVPRAGSTRTTRQPPATPHDRQARAQLAWIEALGRSAAGASRARACARIDVAQAGDRGRTAAAVYRVRAT